LQNHQSEDSRHENYKPNHRKSVRKRSFCALLDIPYGPTGCFEEYLSDEYKTFLHMLRVIGEQMPVLIRPYAGTGRIPYQYTPFIRSFLANGYFGIEKTSRLIQRRKGEANLRLLCGFTKVPGKKFFAGIYLFIRAGFTWKDTGRDSRPGT
jgi:hypothetical protein